MHFPRMIRILLALAITSLLAFAVACGGGDDDGDEPSNGGDSTPTAESGTGGAADRPDWFPARFPLPADTTVVVDTPEDAGGGTAEFLAPLGFSRVITVMDLNLETPSHGFIIVERTADETEAEFVIDDAQNEYDGTVVLKPSGEQTSIVVTLTPK